MSDSSISLSITEQKGLSNHTSLKRLKNKTNKKKNKKPHTLRKKCITEEKRTISSPSVASIKHNTEQPRRCNNNLFISTGNVFG